MPLSQSKMLIRVDAGISVGARRVNSMLALAREFRRRGGQTVMVVNEIPNSLCRRIENEGTSVHQIRCASGGQEDQFETQEIIELEQPNWLAIGGHAFDSNFVKSISNSVEFLMLTDGIERTTRTDLVVGTRPLSDSDFPCSIFQATNTTRLAGPKFALVDQAKIHQPADRKIVAQARRILVWNQGPDVDNWTLRTLQTLSDMPAKRLVVDCIASPGYLHFAELESFKRHSKVTLRIHRNLDRIEPLVDRTDLAVANGHAGCYRLAYLGVPSILITTPESNSNIIDSLHRHRAAVSVAHTTDTGPNRSSDLVKTIKKLVGDRFRRHSMSRHGMDLVDGKGPKRVLNRMARCMFSFRPATTSDSELLWQWQNDPESRSVALNSGPISWPVHVEQFQNSLSSDDQEIWLAVNRSNSPFGKIGVCFEPHINRATLDLNLEQKYRGRGTGAVLIEAAAEKLFAETDVNEVVGQIRSGNAASEKSFRQAGFIAIAPKIINGFMASQFIRHRQPEADRNSHRQIKVA